MEDITLWQLTLPLDLVIRDLTARLRISTNQRSTVVIEINVLGKGVLARL